MATQIADIRSLVIRKIQDRAGFLTATAGGDLDAFIEEAVKEYSRARPQVIVEDEAGDGGFDYQLTGTGGTNLLASWEKGFSEIRKLVHPVDDASATEQVVDEDDFVIITKVTGTPAEGRDFLRFFAATPTSTERFRVFYTARHVLSQTTSTLPAADDEAVSSLAAAMACEALSARYAGTKDASLDADSADYRSRSAEYRQLARQYYRAFLAHMGIREEATAPGEGVLVDLDLGFQWQRPFLFHGGRRR